MEKYWFKAKRYGWGWRPVTWQGWIIMLVYVAALILTVYATGLNKHSTSDSLFTAAAVFVALTLLLLAICYQTGEKPRWRWGDNDSEASDPKKQ